jgi:uncharacterized protein
VSVDPSGSERPGDAPAGAPFALRIGISELRRRPGNRQHVERTVRLGEAATSTATVSAPGDVELDLHMESLTDGVTVTGVVRVPWTGECRRCLEPTSGVIDAEVLEVYKDHPDDGEILGIDGDTLDLGPVVHDAAVMALPVAPLCREDCPGPDPDAFPVRTVDESAEPPRDPRWGALDELRFDSDPPESLS